MIIKYCDCAFKIKYLLNHTCNSRNITLSSLSVRSVGSHFSATCVRKPFQCYLNKETISVLLAIIFLMNEAGGISCNGRSISGDDRAAWWRYLIYILSTLGEQNVNKP